MHPSCNACIQQLDRHRAILNANRSFRSTLHAAKSRRLRHIFNWRAVCGADKYRSSSKRGLPAKEEKFAAHSFRTSAVSRNPWRIARSVTSCPKYRLGDRIFPRTYSYREDIVQLKRGVHDNSLGESYAFPKCGRSRATRDNCIYTEENSSCWCITPKSDVPVAFIVA